MNAREFLSTAFNLNEEIKVKEEEIERLEDMLSYRSPILGERVTKSNNLNITEELICKIADFKESLTKNVLELFDLRTCILDEINKVENSKTRMVLFLRYIKLCSWEEISAETNYGIRQVYNIHNKGLEELDVINGVCGKVC